MKDIGIIGSADGPTSIYVSSKDENFLKSGGIVPENDIDENEVSAESNLTDTTEEVLIDISVEEKLNSKTLGENLNSGFKIMGIGMLAVFGVLTILYLVVKIMGYFAKSKKDEEK